MNRQQIEKKTAAVIERQLYQRGYATVEDSLILMGWLEEKYLTHWRKGQVPYLVEFFRQRKNKYFKENKTLIQSAEAHDGNEGFELRLVVGNMEDLTIEQTAD